jgi:hypothetical protein
MVVALSPKVANRSADNERSDTSSNPSTPLRLENADRAPNARPADR